jgi:mono/diheme cytochrome c family protein
MMKKLGILGSALGLVAAVSLAETSTSNTDLARRERGRYLVEGPAHCFMCHSDIDPSREGLPPREGHEGGGQSPFCEVNLPWLTAPNISPDPDTGAGRWSDAQFARAIRQGIGADGRTLFPMMPYPLFRSMSDEDLASVIAYLRSIPPVRKAQPPSKLPEPVKASLRPLPPPGEVPAPDPADRVAVGAYLTRIANCTGCHTPIDGQGASLAGMDWAGGLNLVGPWGDVHSVNLTPDPSGIPYYTEEHFLKVMHTGDVGGRRLNPIMPWGYFRKMTDDDLKAIYAYLKTLTPVKHRIDNTSPRTPCRVCGGAHGLGEMNR